MLIAFLRATLCVSALVLLPAAHAQQKASQIPVETFLKRAEYTNMALSPDGKLLAALTPFKGRENLVVVDLEKRSKTVITAFDSFDVADFQWVNNKRLFFRVADFKDAAGRIQYAGTYAVDADGNEARDLSKLVAGKNPTALLRLSQIVPLARTVEESDDFIVAMAERRREASDVYRLNTRSGRFTLLSFDAPADTDEWIVDWDGVPRLVSTVDQSKPSTSWWYRTDDKSPWTLLYEAGITEDSPRVRPLAFGKDNRTLYVWSNQNRDKAAIFKYDPATKTLGELVFEHPMIDITGGLIMDRTTRSLLGIRYSAEMPETKWFDPEYDKLQKQLDATLPNTVNRMTRGQDNTNRHLVYASSGVDPGKYYLLSKSPLALEEIVPTRPWIKPELMSPRKFVKYKARDGLEIPAWVTIPKDSSGKNLPLVVNIHGGPWVRVYHGVQWGRYMESQFFASRGYVTLEAEPRASAGFGRKHLVAGYRQFGQAMQDDITDGVLYLVKEGIVDPKKVCLFGGSYGGYATLQGLAKEPDMFRCGVAWIALTDLVLFQTLTYTDFNASGKMNWDPVFSKQVGNLKTDREMLEKYSPNKNARNIKAPVLLVMGSNDQRVPIIHGTTMHNALNDAGVKNEFVVYDGEAHGFNKDANVFDFMKRTEKFLAENLK